MNKVTERLNETFNDLKTDVFDKDGGTFKENRAVCSSSIMYVRNALRSTQLS